MANKKNDSSSASKRGWFGDSERHRAAGRMGGRKRHKKSAQGSESESS